LTGEEGQVQALDRDSGAGTTSRSPARRFAKGAQEPSFTRERKGALPLARSTPHLNKLGPTLVLISILWLGFGLRLYRLGEQNIWWDEGHAIWTAGQSLAQATDITAHDVHPPLYLWLLHGWLRLAGESEFAVRYLSTIAGMLTISLTCVVARRLLGRRTALLATLLIATARFHIWWSQETRMYVWATFFALLSLYLMIRLRHGGHAAWWLYILASVAALYTLYLAALVLLLENLFVALAGWRRPRRRRFVFNWVLAQLGIVTLYVPWLQIALGRTRTDVAATGFPFRLTWQLYGTVLTTGISTNLDRYVWLLVPFGLLAGAGIAVLFLDRRQPQRFGFASWEIGFLFLLSLVLPPLVVYGLSIPRGFFYSPKPEARYLLLFAPLFYILLAGTMASFWQKGRWGQILTIGATVLVLGTFVSVLPGHYSGRYMRDEYQTAMQTLAAYAQPADAVLLVSGDRYPLFLYYYQRQFPDRDGPAVYLMPQHSVDFTPENVGSELGPLAERYQRLWLASFERSLQDPQNLVEQWLDAHRRPALNVSEGYNYLRLYVPGSSATGSHGALLSLVHVQPQHPLYHSLGHGVLLGYDLPTTEFRPGDTIQAAIYVRAEDALDLRLSWVNSAGETVAVQSLQVAAPASGSRIVRETAALTVYEYTAPGRYWLEVCPVAPGTNCAALPLGRVTYSRRLPARTPTVQRQVTLGGGAIRFLGYSVAPARQVEAGRSLTIDLYWQVEAWLHQDYTVFVHLLGPYNPATGGPIWAQDDSYPLGGGHPTSRWLPGQVVPDRHVLAIPQETPSGSYQIEIGLYDANTGERLAVAPGSAESGADSSGNRILLDQIQIVQP
jgi:4-amino-4-deoxy-L-arabinose transferase-like glycosyltransferase